jgi:hypothetical protein
MDFVTIYRAFDESRAQVLFSSLEAAGFHPVLKNAESILMLGSQITAGAVQLLVPENEAEDARRLVDDFQQQANSGE